MKSQAQRFLKVTAWARKRYDMNGGGYSTYRGGAAKYDAIATAAWNRYMA